MRDWARITGFDRELEWQRQLQRDVERFQGYNKKIEKFLQVDLVTDRIYKREEWKWLDELRQVSFRNPIEEYARQLESVGQKLRIVVGDIPEEMAAITSKIAAIASMKPLVDPVLLGLVPNTLLSIDVDSIARLNYSIEHATYIGEVSIPTEEEEGDEETGQEASAEPEQTLEDRLIKVVPAETLTQLKNVDFLPLTTLEQILRSPDAMRSFGSRDFERFVATLIDQLGFEDVVITPRSGDQGRDIIATKTFQGISLLFAFECKQYKNPVGPDIFRALLGTVRHSNTFAHKGVLVTTSTFTSGVRSYLLTEPSLDGKDFNGVVDWLKEYAKRSRQSMGTASAGEVA